MNLMTEKLVKSLEKEIERLSTENSELKERANFLQINQARQIQEHEQNKNEITERIEAKFSELIAAGLNENELKNQVEGMRIELSKILDEKETQLIQIEQKERELSSLRSEKGELESELASTVARKEAQV